MDEVEQRAVPVRAVLEVMPAEDPNLRGAAVLDRAGVAQVATEPALAGTNHSGTLGFKQALLGAEVISEVHLAGPEGADVPTITYLQPVPGVDGAPQCFVALWVRATALWQLAKASNELAGRGSFAVVFDQNGVRVAHTSLERLVFHPAGPLPPAVVEAQVAERRFGKNTRTWLEEVWPAPEQLERALAPAPPEGVFRGYTPGTRSWTFSVARRLRSVRWTVVYVLPEQTLDAQLAATTRRNAAFAGVIMVLALSAGAGFAAVMLRPIGALSRAAERFGRGELGTRAPATARADELGRLMHTFNTMADSLQAQSAELHAARANLEAQVEQRTARLAETAAALAASEEDLRVTLHSIADAVIATDLSGHVRRMNAAAEALTGWELAAAKGKPLAQVFTVLDEDTRASPLEGPVERILREGPIANLARLTLLIAGARRPHALLHRGRVHGPGDGVPGRCLEPGHRQPFDVRRLRELVDEHLRPPPGTPPGA